MKEAMDGSEDGVRVGGELLQDVRFADDKAMVDSTEDGLKKTKVMKISRKGAGLMRIVIGGQQVEQVQHFQYLGTWISENGSCEREIRTRIGMAKEAFKKHKELLTKTSQRSQEKNSKDFDLDSHFVWKRMLDIEEGGDEETECV